MGDLVVEQEKSKLIEEAEHLDDAAVDQEDADVEEAQEELLGDYKGEKGHTELEKKPFIRMEDVLIEVTPENIHRFTLDDVIFPVYGH